MNRITSFALGLSASIAGCAIAAPAAPALPEPSSVRIDQLKLMQGFPPPADQQVTKATYMYQYPQMRWAFHHMRELLPTRAIERGQGPVVPLVKGQDLTQLIDQLRFTGPEGSLSFAEYLDATYTDALLVMHKGQVVYERYLGMPESSAHIMWSMTKSMVGLIATQLIVEGALDANQQVTHYLPELAQSGWQGATVQQVLDMTADINYSEVYSDAHSDVVKYGRALALASVPDSYDGPRSLYAYLPTITGNGAHDQEFQYRTVHTEVLAWILRRVTGLNSAELFSQKVWSKLGTEHEAYLLLDPAGTDMAGGGMNASLRDLARFAEMLRQNGTFNGQQVISAKALAMIQQGADPVKFQAAKRPAQAGYSYHNQFWISHNADGAFELLGIHGQMIHVNPKAELVVVRLGSHPVASSGAHLPYSLPAFAALAAQLRDQ